MSWLSQTLVAVVFLTPAWLAMPFFAKNYGVSGSVFGVWYFIGTAVSIAIFAVPRSELVPSWTLVGSLIGMGFLLGGISNNLLFSAVVSAPNPGLPVAIANLTALATFVCAFALVRIAPTYFAEVTFDLQSLGGVVLILVGTALIAVR